MTNVAYDIRFPLIEPHVLDQHEAYFILREKEEVNMRFHDYAELYKRPGLYEQLFYERLQCSSPAKVIGILENVLLQNRVEMSELRMLDLGAGNGMVGELLRKKGVARVIGVDILQEAYLACERDRPGVYDAYYVANLAVMDDALSHELGQWRIDCMLSVAALGFDDIPPEVFAAAFNLVQDGGWIAFNIKETFLNASDTSGFAQLVKNLIHGDILKVHHLERYRHRISIDGRPLYYYAIAGKKESNISQDVFLSVNHVLQHPGNRRGGFVRGRFV